MRNPYLRLLPLIFTLLVHARYGCAVQVGLADLVHELLHGVQAQDRPKGSEGGASGRQGRFTGD